MKAIYAVCVTAYRLYAAIIHDDDKEKEVKGTGGLWIPLGHALSTAKRRYSWQCYLVLLLHNIHC